MTQILKALTGAALVLAISLPLADCAFAQARGQAFKRIDTNNDGYIESSELVARRLAAFDRADTNHDGMLTKEEVAAAREAAAQRRAARGGDLFDRLDTDKNGSVTRAEVANAPTPLIKMADKDGDGKLSREELRDFLRDMRARRDNR